MNYLFAGLQEALRMIFHLDREMLSIVMVSLKVSSLSILLATLTGIPFGFFVAIKHFPGKRIVVVLLHTLLSLPTVVVGLLLYSFLSRRGPLGNLGLLYTPWAMVLGQWVLSFPIVSCLSLNATQSLDARAKKTAMILGATHLQSASLLLFEARAGLAAAVIAGFGRVFGEIGVSMMLGGNIRAYTRNITTAIALETGKGEFALGIALGLVLLSISFLLNIIFYYLRNKNISA
ncbi:MAG: ABC transporter permease subunit [Caldiserica bacterium]|nr:ABC transporter permease subunit [Caldisericota bacterium]